MVVGGVGRCLARELQVQVIAKGSHKYLFNRFSEVWSIMDVSLEDFSLEDFICNDFSWEDVFRDAFCLRDFSLGAFDVVL
jgi:hypothetical protein